MVIEKVLSLMNKYGKCPKCGNSMLGKCQGKLIIEDAEFIRECKCGYKIKTDEYGLEIQEYKCTKDFYINKADDEGGLTDKQMKIKAKSKWILEESGYRVIDGEIRLVKANSCTWIEISKESFRENFIKI